jgi:hypothetical protein
MQSKYKKEVIIYAEGEGIRDNLMMLNEMFPDKTCWILQKYVGLQDWNAEP